MTTSHLEHLVFLTNAQGDQARVAALRVQGNLQHALRIAASHAFQDFNVIERCDSPEGFSDQRVATFRRGVRA